MPIMMSLCVESKREDEWVRTEDACKQWRWVYAQEMHKLLCINDKVQS
jgi:hypothetical protein